MIPIPVFYLLFGILIVTFFMPVINSITELILTAIEVLKSYLSIKIFDNNNKMEIEPDCRPIGFQYIKEEELDDEEDL